MKTQAIIKYRSYVPSDWIAIEFFHLDFHGADKQTLKNEWHKIEYSEYDKYPECDSLNLEIDKLEKEIKGLKWYQSGNKIRRELENKKEKLSKINKKRFKSVYTLHYEAKQFLENKGFFLESKTSNGRDCEVITEIYNKN